MVKPESMKEFMLDVQDTFGFLLAQAIAMSPFTPKDTGRLAQSFPGTYTFNRATRTISFTTPFYAEYLLEGTKHIVARPFITQIIHQRGQELLKQAFRINDKKWRNK